MGRAHPAQPGPNIVKAETATGSIVFTLDKQQPPTETTKYGLEGAKAAAAGQAAAVAKAPSTWLAAAQTAVQEAMQQERIAAPMTAGQLSARMHPDAVKLIHTLIDRWNDAYRSCNGTDQAKRANAQLDAELRTVEQQINELDMSVAEVNLSFKKQMVDDASSMKALHR